MSLNALLRPATLLAAALILFGACAEDAPPVGPGDPPPDSSGLLLARTTGPYTSADGSVLFDGRGSHAATGRTLAGYRWDFGDGNTSTAAAPVHSYVADGDYQVTLTVTDSLGDVSAPARTTAKITGVATAAIVLTSAGNIATCAGPNDEATARLVEAQPGFVFTLGDNAFPSGTAADYACFAATWGRARNRTFAVLGNHDWDDGAGNPAFDYFGTKAGPRGQGYYSLNIGAWHVVVLNDNLPVDAGSAQLAWLQADLAANQRQCTIALWHLPLWVSSPETAGHVMNYSRKDIWEVLHPAGVDVVLNGHAHHYERMAPMDPEGARNDGSGVRQFNVGTGGGSVQYPSASTHPNSEVRGAVFGVLKLTLRPGAYDWQFLPVAGASLNDSGSGSCH